MNKMVKSIKYSLVTFGAVFSLYGNAIELKPMCYIPNLVGEDCSTIGEHDLYHGTIKPACVKHDVCYATLGANKNQCDDQLYSDAVRECKDEFGIDDYPDSLEFERKACELAAATVYDGVRLGGLEAWIEEQQDAVAQFVIFADRTEEAAIGMEGSCVALPERMGNRITSEMLNFAKTTIESYTGHHATTSQLFSVINSYYPRIGGGSYSSWKSELSSKVPSLVSGLPYGQAAYSVSTAATSTTFTASAIDVYGVNPELYLEGYNQGASYTDQYSPYVTDTGLYKQYVGYGVVYRTSAKQEVVDFVPINFTRNIRPEGCVKYCDPIY